MTKADESLLLAKWISEAPADSYLRGTLRHIQLQFEQDTRSDFACLPELPAIEREIRNAQASLAEAERQVAAAGGKVLELETKAKNAQRTLDTIRASARDLADKLRLL